MTTTSPCRRTVPSRSTTRNYFTAPANTGVAFGFDLGNDGTVGRPGDAFGFREFPGQYGMVVLSRYPIFSDEVRTFQPPLRSSLPARLPR